MHELTELQQDIQQLKNKLFPQADALFHSFPPVKQQAILKELLLNDDKHSLILLFRLTKYDDITLPLDAISSEKQWKFVLLQAAAKTLIPELCCLQFGKILKSLQHFKDNQSLITQAIHAIAVNISNLSIYLDTSKFNNTCSQYEYSNERFRQKIKRQLKEQELYPQNNNKLLIQLLAACPTLSPSNLLFWVNYNYEYLNNQSLQEQILVCLDDTCTASELYLEIFKYSKTLDPLFLNELSLKLMAVPKPIAQAIVAKLSPSEMQGLIAAVSATSIPVQCYWVLLLNSIKQSHHLLESLLQEESQVVEFLSQDAQGIEAQYKFDPISISLLLFEQIQDDPSSYKQLFDACLNILPLQEDSFYSTLSPQHQRLCFYKASLKMQIKLFTEGKLNASQATFMLIQNCKRALSSAKIRYLNKLDTQLQLLDLEGRSYRPHSLSQDTLIVGEHVSVYEGYKVIDMAVIESALQVEVLLDIKLHSLFSLPIKDMALNLVNQDELKFIKSENKSSYLLMLRLSLALMQLRLMESCNWSGHSQFNDLTAPYKQVLTKLNHILAPVISKFPDENCAWCTVCLPINEFFSHQIDKLYSYQANIYPNLWDQLSYEPLAQRLLEHVELEPDDLVLAPQHLIGPLCRSTKANLLVPENQLLDPQSIMRAPMENELLRYALLMFALSVPTPAICALPWSLKALMELENSLFYSPNFNFTSLAKEPVQNQQSIYLTTLDSKLTYKALYKAQHLMVVNYEGYILDQNYELIEEREDHTERLEEIACKYNYFEAYQNIINQADIKLENDGALVVYNHQGSFHLSSLRPNLNLNALLEHFHEHTVNLCVPESVLGSTNFSCAFHLVSTSEDRRTGNLSEISYYWNSQLKLLSNLLAHLKHKHCYYVVAREEDVAIVHKLQSYFELKVQVLTLAQIMNSPTYLYLLLSDNGCLIIDNCLTKLSHALYQGACNLCHSEQVAILGEAWLNLYNLGRSVVEHQQQSHINATNQANTYILEGLYTLLSTQAQLLAPLERVLQVYLLEPNFEQDTFAWDIDFNLDDNDYSLRLNQNTISYSKLLLPIFDDDHAEQESREVVRALLNDTKRKIDIDIEETIQRISEGLIGGNQFYQYQYEALQKILNKQNDYIINLPTGSGKSVLFQGPALFGAPGKLSIVVSPLKALITEQVTKLQAKDFAVDFLSSDKKFHQNLQVIERAQAGALSMLYVTPERFRVSIFSELLRDLFQNKRIGYIIFDEAHCICQWGRSFRPDYIFAAQKIACYAALSSPKVPIIMCSATMTAQVVNSIKSYLQKPILLEDKASNNNPIRSHIDIYIEDAEDDYKRIEQIADFIKLHDIDFKQSRMLVFYRNRQGCRECAFALNQLALQAAASQGTQESSALAQLANHVGYYHAGLGKNTRAKIYKCFANQDIDEAVIEANDEEVKDHSIWPLELDDYTLNTDKELYVLFATSAFGLGMDVPNIHYIVHYRQPSCIEDLLQEVGRAGRDLQQYQKAFPNGKQIPALCLFDKDYLAHQKEHLTHKLVGWSDVLIAEKAIQAYFKERHPDYERHKIVPLDIVSRDLEHINYPIFRGHASSDIKPRIILQTLEEFSRIKLGYYRQVPFMVSYDLAKLKSANILFANALAAFIEDENLPPQGTIPLNFFDYHSQLDKCQKNYPSLQLKFYEFLNTLLLMIKEGLITMPTPTQIKLGIHSINKSFNPDYDNLLESTSHIPTLHYFYIVLKNMWSKYKCQNFQDLASHKYQIKDIILDYWKEKIGEDLDLENDSLCDDFTYSKALRFFTSSFTFAFARLKRHFRDKDICSIPIYTFFKVLVYDLSCVMNYVYQNLHSPYFNWAQILLDLNLLRSFDEHDIFYGELLLRFRLEGDEDKSKLFTEYVHGFRYFSLLIDLLNNLSQIHSSKLLEIGYELTILDQEPLPAISGIDNTDNHYYQALLTQEQVARARLLCLELLCSQVNKKQYSDFIKNFFAAQNLDDYVKILERFDKEQKALDELSNKALNVLESKIKDNPDQQAIYDESLSEHSINVMAGPGAGKTFILLMKVARLVLSEHVPMRHILVLAYNRAVVVELKNRLHSLFNQLGLGSLAYRIPIFTFHGFAKYCLGQELNDINPNNWDTQLLEKLRNEPNLFEKILPDLQYVMVDEFQDITFPRLYLLLLLKQSYTNLRYFTIGDINQSIYGFDRINSARSPLWGNLAHSLIKDQEQTKDNDKLLQMCDSLSQTFSNTNNFAVKQPLSAEQYKFVINSQTYYEILKRALKPKCMHLKLNYRSYQKILDYSYKFLNDQSFKSQSFEGIQNYEPKSNYAFEFNKPSQFLTHLPSVLNKLRELNQEAKEQDFRDEIQKERYTFKSVAMLFRTNHELYSCLPYILQSKADDVQIIIQGLSPCELFRVREFYALIAFFNQRLHQELLPGFAQELQNHCQSLIDTYSNWDTGLIDRAYCVALSYQDELMKKDGNDTYADLKEYYQDLLRSSAESAQVQKLYERHKDKHLIKSKPIELTLSTMHKVKGLEFDMIMIAPSKAPLPLSVEKDGTAQLDAPLNLQEQYDILEEKNLYYVAYTRARKYLFAYRGQREQALAQNLRYLPEQEPNHQYCNKEPKLDHYFLNFNTSDLEFANNRYIEQQVKIHDHAAIVRQGNFFIVLHYNLNTQTWNKVGRLSSNNPIAKAMQANMVRCVNNLFVSDIVVWTYEDTENIYRADNSKDYRSAWGRADASKLIPQL